MRRSKHAIASQERRVKRLGYRYGVILVKCAKPFGRVLQHGGYLLRHEETGKIVFGADGYDYSATLDEVEEFLRAQPSWRRDEDV